MPYIAAVIVCNSLVGDKAHFRDICEYLEWIKTQYQV